MTTFLAAQQDFEQLNGPPGGYFWDIQQNDDGLYLAKTNHISPYQAYSFYSSIDGINWTEINQSDFPCYSHTIGNDKNLYYTKNSFLYKSTDIGQTWQQLGDGNTTPLGAFVSAQIKVTSNGTILIIGSSFGYRSTDEGLTWEELDFQIGNLMTGVDFMEDIDTGALFLVANSWPDGLYRSMDAGLTWDNVLTSPNSIFSMNAAFASNGDLYSVLNGDLFRSGDLGENWETANVPYLGTHRHFNITANDRIIISYQDEAIFTDNYGLTWSDFTEEEDFVTIRQIYPAEDGAVFFQIYRGLYKTENVFADANYAAYGTPYTPVNKFAFHNNKVFASNTSGVWQTEDNGQSWDLIYDRIITYSRIGNSSFSDHNSENDFFFNHGDIIFRQLNGETIFTDITPDVVSSPFSAPPGSIVFVSSADNLLCIIDDILYISQDKGETWSSNEDIEVANSRADIFQNEAGRLFITTYDMLYYSDNEGTSWTELPKPFTLRSTINNQGNIISIVGFEDYCYLSTDQGQTWQEVSIPDPVTATRISVTSTPEGHFYVSDDEDIIRSVDGGETWTIFEIDEEVSFDNFDGSGMGLSPDGHMYISTYGNYRSTSPLNDIIYIQGLSVVDDNLDCVLDAEEMTVLSGQIVQLSTGDNNIFFVTPADAEYTVAGEPGEYSLNAVSPNYLWSECVENFTLTEEDYSQTVVANALLSPILDCPYMTVDVAVPFLRRCFSTTLSVHYKNEGTITASGAYLTVDLDEFLIVDNTSVPISSQTNNQLTFELGDLDVNQSGQILITLTVSCDAELGMIHCVEANVFPKEICGENPLWSGAIIEAESTCEGEEVIFILSNTGTGDMTEEGTYQILNNELVVQTNNYQLGMGESLEIPYVATEGGILRILTSDVEGYPFPGNPTAFEYECSDSQDNIIFSNWNAGSNSEPFSDGFCLENIGAYDPNDKRAFPEGYGFFNQIEANTDLKYLIRFQNTGTDTAFTVIVRDTLDDNLDLSSIRTGARSHSYDLSIEEERILVFTFNDIMLPDSTTNLLASNGFFQFSVRQKEDLAIGTSLNNSAAIYFDFNEPVITNTISHTIGTDFVEILSGIDNSEEKKKVVLSPHPVFSRSILSLPEDYSGNNNMKIYNSRGLLVKSRNFSNNTTPVERNDLTKGVYWIQVVSEDNSSLTLKMIVL